MNNYYRQAYPQSNANTNLQTNQFSQMQNQHLESLYLEDNLLLNLGNIATVHMSFPDSLVVRDKSFYGIIAEVARDHIVIGDPNTDKWYMLPITYLNYVEFNEKPKLFK